MYELGKAVKKVKTCVMQVGICASVRPKRNTCPLVPRGCYIAYQTLYLHVIFVFIIYSPSVTWTFCQHFALMYSSRFAQHHSSSIYFNFQCIVCVWKKKHQNCRILSPNLFAWPFPMHQKTAACIFPYLAFWQALTRFSISRGNGPFFSISSWRIECSFLEMFLIVKILKKRFSFSSRNSRFLRKFLFLFSIEWDFANRFSSQESKFSSMWRR